MVVYVWCLSGITIFDSMFPGNHLRSGRNLSAMRWNSGMRVEVSFTGQQS